MTNPLFRRNLNETGPVDVACLSLEMFAGFSSPSVVSDRVDELVRSMKKYLNDALAARRVGLSERRSAAAAR